MAYLQVRANNLSNGVCQISFHFQKESCTCLVEMLNVSVVRILSIMLEMSECSIHNDEVVESRLKNLVELIWLDLMNHDILELDLANLKNTINWNDI